MAHSGGPVFRPGQHYGPLAVPANAQHALGDRRSVVQIFSSVAIRQDDSPCRPAVCWVRAVVAAVDLVAMDVQNRTRSLRVAEAERVRHTDHLPSGPKPYWCC